jgi:hypothetical protein
MHHLILLPRDHEYGIATTNKVDTQRKATCRLRSPLDALDVDSNEKLFYFINFVATHVNVGAVDLLSSQACP